MNDDQAWAFEDSLWRADEAHYRESIDAACLMVVPGPPYIVTGDEAATAVANTPRWDKVDFSETRLSRPHDSIIVIAYRVLAEKPDAEAYDARCTSTYREGDDGKWTVVQHQQTPVLAG